MTYSGSRPGYQKINEHDYNEHLLRLAELRIFRPEYLFFLSQH